MLSKFDWKNVIEQAIGGIITAAIVALTAWVWSRVPSGFRIPLAIGASFAIAFVWVAVLGVIRLRMFLKFRSRLSIEVIDVNCFLQNVTVKSAYGGQQRDEIRWRPEYLIEVENKRKAPVTDIEGEVRLFLGNTGGQPMGKRLERFSLGGRQSKLYWLKFPQVAFSREHTGMYPKGQYRLVLTYSCLVASKKLKERTAVIVGRFEKADWLDENGRLSDLLNSLWVFGVHSRG
jgi:hypothetical protein